MKSQWWRWIAPPLFVLLPIFCHAGGKPEITQVNAQYLDNAVNINVHWQSPNPVVSLKVLAGKEQQEVKIDEYANKRNRRGYSGEATVVLNVEPRPEIAFISYVVYLQDDLNQKSEQRVGKVKVPTAYAGIQAGPPVQVGVQTGVQVGVQVGTPPGPQPPGTLEGSPQPLVGIDINQPGFQGGGQSQAGGQYGQGASASPPPPGGTIGRVLSVMERHDTPPYLHNVQVNRFSGNNVSFSTKALDDKGLREITFRIFEATGNAVQDQTLNNLGKIWQGTSKPFQLPAGKYKVVVQAVDSSGNTSPERSATFEVTGQLVPPSGSSGVQNAPAPSTAPGVSGISITVYLDPPEAVNAGAQWRVSGGNWQGSGAMISGLSAGQVFIEFKDLPGWTKPVDQPVNIQEGQPAIISGFYTPAGGSSPQTSAVPTSQ